MSPNLFPATTAAIARVGARSPLGMNALQVGMAARSRALEPRGTPWRDKRHGSIGAVHARFLPDTLYGLERWIALAAPALREAARGLGEPVPLVVGVPEADRPDDDPRISAELCAGLERAAGVRLKLDGSAIVRAGHASFGFVLAQALAQLELGATSVLCGAIESYYHPDVLHWLDESCRLHARGTEDGFIPSEGAAFAWLVRAEVARNDKAWRALCPTQQGPIAWVRAVATGHDEEAVLPDTPLLAQVMTGLVRQAAAPLGSPLAWIMSDLNGEYHRLREWSRVELRMSPAMTDALHERLPDRMGDVGAASGALALAVSGAQWQTGCAPAARLLCALHSDGTARAAFALEAAS